VLSCDWTRERERERLISFLNLALTHTVAEARRGLNSEGEKSFSPQENIKVSSSHASPRQLFFVIHLTAFSSMFDDRRSDQ